MSEEEEFYVKSNGGQTTLESALATSLADQLQQFARVRRRTVAG